MATDQFNSQPARLRVALYSHDTMGLGHLRRNLLIGGVLSDAPVHADVLLISGAREACHFAMMQGVDCITLPALYKDDAGQYSSKFLRASCRETTSLRSKVIAASIDSFAPHLFVVDKVPRGIGGELDETLRLIRAKGNTKSVLGLREILDDPDSVARQWRSTNAELAIREHYDEVWIYGDPQVYDSIDEYSFSNSTVERASYMGYLDQRRRIPCNDDHRSESDQNFVVCVVGGGQDGAALAQSFANVAFPVEMPGVLIPGPFMPTADRCRLRKLAQENRGLRMIDDVVEADHYISRADRVVSMAGYNTISSILSFGKPALVVPRMNPRREQRIRAQTLHDRGVLTMLEPSRLTPAAIARWISRSDVASPQHSPIDIGGLDRIINRVGQLLPAFVSGSRILTEANFV